MTGRIDGATIVKKDMDALYLGNLKTVEFDLNLPDKGEYGSTITWESGDQRFITNQGKVERPAYGMGNREVLLFGHFSYEGVKETKEYHVVVLEHKNPHEEDEVHEIICPDYMEQLQEKKAGKEKACSVKILPGNEFYDTQQWMKQVLLNINDDDMLFHFRDTAGLDTKGGVSPIGWDAKDSQLRGHTTGHYMSALAWCYQATLDEKIKEKADYMVQAMWECQVAFSKKKGYGEGYLSAYEKDQFDQLEEYTTYPTIWAPYYTLHKIIAGLLDCYTILHNEKALCVAEKVGMWVYRRLSVLPKQQLQKMWSMYIAGEFGGMNEVLAKLAKITGKKELVQCAKLFDNPKLFTPLEQQKDALNGLHANQHIPQVIGALEIYKATGETTYLEIAKNFWATVTQHRVYATGGVGEREMFHGFDEIGGLLTSSTQETCASYNMLKLTKELYRLGPNAGYMDYYEKTLLNHLMATPDRKEGGETTYFFPLNCGAKREFFPENSCCHGTGMENHFRYNEAVAYCNEDGLYINVYLPSEIKTETGSVTLQRLSRKNQSYELAVEGITTLYLRKPEWAKNYSLLADGKKTTLLPDKRGYLKIEHANEVKITFECSFQLVSTPDDESFKALKYGPYVMAAISESGECLHLEDVEKELDHWKENMTEKLTFEGAGYRWLAVGDVTDQAYHVYFK
ncbi:MAG: glycoside hydrolase family 127 protein [Lachnospiraceae bacterium]|nr:glycoside hydrolase family 127 protein [Lachnospiraceae bacterium]